MNSSKAMIFSAALRQRCWSVALVPMLVAIAFGIGAATAAAVTLPVSPVYLNASSAYEGLQVTPPTITYTGDGTGFLGGTDVRNQNSGIAWVRWATFRALGRGFNQLNNCRPSCAGGHFHGYPVRIEMWRPRSLGGVLVFTRMTIFYKKHRPRREPRHYTFTDTYRSGGYSWGPPDAEGYCIDTHGLPPEPTCKNIHSLPSK